MADTGTATRTVRGRIEPRSAREHRKLEKLFRAAQEARNALIEDSLSTFTIVDGNSVTLDRIT